MARPDRGGPSRARLLLVTLAVLATLAGGGLVAVQAGWVTTGQLAAWSPRNWAPPAWAQAVTSFFGSDDATAPDAPGGDGPVPPPPDAEDTAPNSAAEERQAQLLEAEDDRLFTIVSEAPKTLVPYEVAAGGQALPTVVLTARSRPYDLPALERLGAVEHQPDGAWLLRRSVVVGRGAELRLQEPNAVLRLTSTPSGFTSIVAFKGTLVLAGGPGAPMTVSSWDPATSAPDVNQDDGRAYIRAVGARMDLTQVGFSDLGFWSGRSGGVAWTGSAGSAATGSATEVTVDRDHYGLFTSRVGNLTINDSTVRDNDLDGLLLHRETDGLVARRVTATGNGRDGISASRGSKNVTFTEVTTSANRQNGIRIDGSALAAEATAGGASTARGAGYTVERSTVTGNVEEGILVAEAGQVTLRDNTVGGNRDGIVVRGPAEGPSITGNTIDAAGFGLALRSNTRGATVTGNTIGASVIGVQVTDSTANIRGNRTTASSRYGVSLVGDVTGTAVVDNTLGGRGLAPLDVNRIAVTSTADVLGNDDRTWVRDRNEVEYVVTYAQDHPLLLLWLLILVLPLLARLWTKRRKRIRAEQEHEHPYSNAAPGPPAPARGNVDVITSIRRDNMSPPVLVGAAGPQGNGHPTNGSPVDGQPPNGRAINGHPAPGRRVDGRPGNGRAVHGQPVDAQGRGGPQRPRRTPQPPPAAPTVALPVTRVTVVSGDGARQ